MRDCFTEPMQIIANSDNNTLVLTGAFPLTSGSFTDYNERTQNVRNINLLINQAN